MLEPHKDADRVVPFKEQPKALQEQLGAKQGATPFGHSGDSKQSTRSTSHQLGWIKPCTLLINQQSLPILLGPSTATSAKRSIACPNLSMGLDGPGGYASQLGLAEGPLGALRSRRVAAPQWAPIWEDVVC